MARFVPLTQPRTRDTHRGERIATTYHTDTSTPTNSLEVGTTPQPRGSGETHSSQHHSPHPWGSSNTYSSSLPSSDRHPRSQYISPETTHAQPRRHHSADRNSCEYIRRIAIIYGQNNNNINVGCLAIYSSSFVTHRY